MEKQIRNFLRKKRGYLKKSNTIILERLGISPVTKKKLEICGKIKREIINESREVKKPNYSKIVKDLSKYKVDAKQLEEEYYLMDRVEEDYDPDNILVIGDIHEPFCLDGYLEFCKRIQHQEKCGTVVFIGDVIDNHFASYHETDPDGYGAGEELDRAIYKLKAWYDAFPEATVIIGNHDRLIYRKAYSSGLSRRWIRDLNEVLETPNWEFVEEVTINGVCYNHGEGGTARTRIKNEMQSQVQGHLHNQFYIDYIVSPSSRIFGMQVGCGVDRHAYAKAYGKHFKKPVIGCATVTGKNPIPRLHPMDL